MKISVIIPCYNAEDQIRDCIDCLLCQTIGLQHLEIICIDDKSTDHTLDILMEYEEKYPEQLLLLPLEQNGKQGNARNMGLQYASGDFVTFLDSDDYLASDALRHMYECMQKQPCDFVECDYTQTQSKHPGRQETAAQAEQSDPRIFDMRDRRTKCIYILQRGWQTRVWGRLFRREFLTEHQILFPTDCFMEDIYFEELCMLYAETIVHLPIAYYFYHINPQGTMQSDKILNYYMDTPKVQNMTTERAISENLLDDCLAEFQVLHFSKAVVEPLSRMQQDSRFYKEENIKKIRESILYYFPDIIQNPYILRDPSPNIQHYRHVLEGNPLFTE